MRSEVLHGKNNKVLKTVKTYLLMETELRAYYL